jgi:hypothetical protein
MGRNTRFRSTGARRLAMLGLVMAVVGSTMIGCMMFARSPVDLDYSRVRASENGIYRATIVPPGDSIPRGRLHSWTLHLETAGGAPVDTAAISVEGGMPRHGHGLPTSPRVTRALGNGDHLLEGMKFNMSGWWVVKFRVDAGAGVDSIVFNLRL